MIDYKVKIQKLLALSESPNEFEAKAALLKARELMALHKIGEIDLVDVREKKVIVLDSGYTYTKRGDFWMGGLASVIARNYCCKPVNYKEHGGQKLNVRFIGFEDDVNMCKTVFDYAVKSAKELGKIYAKENSGGLKKTDVIKSYAYGFMLGVDEAFKFQDESNWGLVMVVPHEVDDYMQNNMNTRQDNYRSKQTVYNRCKNDGYEEGKRFNPNGRLEG